MDLFERFLHYLNALCEGSLAPPEGIALSGASSRLRMGELLMALQGMGVPEFIQRCAEAAGDTLPEGLLDDFDEDAFARDLFACMTQVMSEAKTASAEVGEAVEAGETPEVGEAAEAAEAAETDEAADPDAGKHVFEVLCDCMMLDEGLISYLIEVLKTDDREGFYRLSQITTKRDLDPVEFLYWLGHREDYAEEGERACAVIIDSLLDRLMVEGQPDTAAALLAGDRMTFDAVRCEAPELRQLPVATFRWFEENYLDRDYPLRFVLKCNGVRFPDTLENA